ncbi:desiccation protectant protein Lea14 homolog [Papaver somniferum]|uniref:desiccation protectant protein Lea14 homolog n=1 Tax=Papaver somniferum TaxID=3469 RepID=UPI000E6FB2EA|nr:desiccation protectant protein Lea14 homolog [Papaver somniferum]XP_026426164.1 desiccation protectant protein Lea14 homolog [Papaver somniferum]
MAFIEQAVNFVEEKVAVIVMTPVNFTEETVAILVKKPEATLNDVILKSISFDSVTLLAKVSVSNPYITIIPIGELNYILKSAESVMASGKIQDPVSLTPMKSTLLVIEVKVPYSVVITLLRDASTEWVIDYELQLCFTFAIPVIGDVTIPITGKGEIKLPAISKFLHCGKKEDRDWFSIRNWI